MSRNRTETTYVSKAGVRTSKLRASRVLLLTSFVFLGCEDEVIVPTSALAPKTAASTAKKKNAQTAASATNAASDGEPAPPQVEFQEQDFTETERSRDPFRTFEDLFIEKADKRSLQRARVLLEEYSLDELKLIGVVSRINPAKAMVVDPLGKGHVIQRNDLVGRAERVQAGTSNEEFEVNWRVDRIRESDVVFVREDPANPDVPSATRVLSLHSDDDAMR